MHKLVLSLALAGALVGTSAGVSMTAMAAAPATMTTTGTVLSTDTKHCTVTLSNQGTYLFAKRCNLSKVTVGEWVTITWWLNGDTRNSTKIAAATPMSGMMGIGMGMGTDWSKWMKGMDWSKWMSGMGMSH